MVFLSRVDHEPGSDQLRGLNFLLEQTGTNPSGVGRRDQARTILPCVSLSVLVINLGRPSAGPGRAARIPGPARRLPEMLSWHAGPTDRGRRWHPAELPGFPRRDHPGLTCKRGPSGQRLALAARQGTVPRIGNARGVREKPASRRCRPGGASASTRQPGRTRRRKPARSGQP